MPGVEGQDLGEYGTDSHFNNGDTISNKHYTVFILTEIPLACLFNWTKSVNIKENWLSATGFYHVIYCCKFPCYL